MLLTLLTGQFKIFNTCKGPPKNDYSLDDSICDFLLYYNDRIHSITKVVPFKEIMKVSDKELMEKHLKRRRKAKKISETYPNGSYIRVSNYIKIIEKEHAHFHRPRGLQKTFIKEKRIVIGKVTYSRRRNYC